MIIQTDPTEAMLAEAAELHRRLLPQSAISRLGRAYTRSFYRFAASSRTEFVFVALDSGTVISAAVLSIEPARLRRRLAARTSLIPRMLADPASAARMILAHALGKVEGSIDPTIPEVIAIFTAPTHQGRGVGAALLRAVEQALRVRGVSRYCVRTEDTPDNRAIAFYEREGFDVVGRLRRPDARFRFMIRRIDEAWSDASTVRHPEPAFPVSTRQRNE